MSKFTKIIAVVVTLVMLLGVVGIVSSAEESPIMKLSSKRTQVTSGSKFEVTVSLSDATQVVGGVEGTITYNKDMFSNPVVTLTDAFTANGNGNAAEVVNTETAGVIKYVGLAGNDTGSDWFTITFDTATVATSSNQTFTITAKGSNKTGTAVQTVASLNVAVNAVPNAVKVMGAQLKYGATVTFDQQDLRFAVNVDKTYLPQDKNAVEFGVLMMFTQRLGDRELTYDMIANNEKGLVVARKLPAEGQQSITVPELFFAQLNGTASDDLNAIKGIRVSARAYVRYDDNTVVYYSNNNEDGRVVAGYSSKSFNGALKANTKLMLDAYTAYKNIDEASRTDAQQAYIDALTEYDKEYPTTTTMKNFLGVSSFNDEHSRLTSMFVANYYWYYLCTLDIAE